MAGKSRKKDIVALLRRVGITNSFKLVRLVHGDSGVFIMRTTEDFQRGWHVVSTGSSLRSEAYASVADVRSMRFDTRGEAEAFSYGAFGIHPLEWRFSPFTRLALIRQDDFTRALAEARQRDA